MLNTVTEKNTNIFEAEGKYIISKMGCSGSFKRRMGTRSAAKASWQDEGPAHTGGDLGTGEGLGVDRMTDPQDT